MSTRPIFKNGDRVIILDLTLYPSGIDVRIGDIGIIDEDECTDDAPYVMLDRTGKKHSFMQERLMLLSEYKKLPEAYKLILYDQIND